MKNYKRNSIILILIAGLILYFALKDDFANILKEILSINIWWFVFAIVLIILYWGISAMYIYLISSSIKKDFTYKKSFILVLLAQFFNAITPFVGGGQPVQVYMLSRDGIKGPTATMIIVQDYIVYQLALFIYAVIAIILNIRFDFFASVPWIEKLALLGFLINIGLVSFFLFMSISKKTNKYLIKKLIRLFTFKKDEEKKEKITNKWYEHVEQFHDSAAFFRKNKSALIKGVIYHFLALTLESLVPLAILYATGSYTELNIVLCLTAGIYIRLSTALVPIPGGSGGKEIAFLTFYGLFIGGPKLMVIMLLWRFITFYLGLILGAVSLIIKNEKEKIL